jgi:hypothetical protein
VLGPGVLRPELRLGQAHRQYGECDLLHEETPL